MKSLIFALAALLTLTATAAFAQRSPGDNVPDEYLEVAVPCFTVAGAAAWGVPGGGIAFFGLCMMLGPTLYGDLVSVTTLPERQGGFR